MAHARKLIHDSAFDADTVKLMGDTFDSAWGMIAPAFTGQPQVTIDDARTVLASSIIHHVKIGVSNPGLLQEKSIAAVRTRFPSLRI